MKVIDLLNKIANGKEVPKKIKIGFSVLTLNDNKDNYLYEDSDEYYGDELIHWFNLNDEVEIIEEAPEETKVSEEQMLFNNLDSIDRERIIQLMKILQPPKANVVISIDYSSCGE